MYDKYCITGSPSARACARFSEHHGFLARVHLDLIDQHTAAIGELTRRIEQVIEPFRGFRDLICPIPGIAGVIVAEIGEDMSRFPTAGHLASWAGTVPGSNESAGKVKSSKTRPGNPYLQGALGTAAMSCAQHPGTYLNAKYRRIATRRGPQKANVAIQHAILVAIWNMGTSGTFCEDPGGDYFTRLNPERARTRAIHQILERSIRQAQARDKVRRNVASLVDVPEGREGRPSNLRR